MRRRITDPRKLDPLFESLEPRKLLAGLTMATHGYQFSGTFPSWVAAMTDAIAQRAGSASDVARYNWRSNDTATAVSVFSVTGTPLVSHASSGEVVGFLDWADASNNFQNPFEPNVSTEQVAIAVKNNLLGTYSNLLSLPIHLIGHSRGGGLMSRLATWLGASGIWVQQLTLLDAYPTSLAGDPPMTLPDNVIFADNYYQRNDFAVQGSPLPGALNFNLTNANGLTIEHTRAHTFYFGTIATSASSEGGGEPVDPHWYTTPGLGPRSEVGFGLSRLGGYRSDSLVLPHVHIPFTGGNARTPLTILGPQWPNIVIDGNGTGSIRSGEMVQSTVYYGDRDSSATITLYLDSDENPFNGHVQQVGSAVSVLSSLFSTRTVSWSAAGITPGNYRLLARISDGGRTRYDYADDPVIVTSAAPTITALSALPHITPLGGTITLTATGVADRDGTIDRVEFFLDNGDGTFDPSSDVFLGADATAAGGYSISVNSVDLPGAGSHRYFVRALDNTGVVSMRSPSAVSRVNAPPTIAGMIGSTAYRLSTTTITALGVLDTGEVGYAGAILSVEFYRDRNSNGHIDHEDGPPIAYGSRITGTSDWRATFTVGRDWSTGINVILARARDNNGAWSDTSTVMVNAANLAPTLTRLSAAPAVVTSLTPTLMLTAFGATDRDGSVSRVEFYQDNGDGVFGPADALVGQDPIAAGGWSLVLSAGNLAPGTHRYFAVAIDNNDTRSVLAVTAAVRVNAAPVVASVQRAEAARLSTAVVVASGITDTTDPEYSGTISLVEFYRDRNANGLLDPVDGPRLAVGTRIVGSHDWQARIVIGRDWPASESMILVRARDNNGAWSAVTIGTLGVSNLPPNAGSIIASPAVLTSQSSALTLRASAPSDRDGAIARVAFHRDNGDGALGPGDEHLGDDTSSTGGWSLVFQSTLAPGTHRYFATVFDADGASASTTISAPVRINALPTIDEFSLSSLTGTIFRSAAFTLTIRGVHDDNAIRSVQIYRDSNGDGVFDAADLWLGAASRVGTTSDWLFTRSGSVLDVGSHRLFVRAQDSNMQFGLPIALIVSVVA